MSVNFEPCSFLCTGLFRLLTITYIIGKAKHWPSIRDVPSSVPTIAIIVKLKEHGEISGSDGGEYKDECLLGCCTGQSGTK
jgi:hypothetical protein